MSKGLLRRQAGGPGPQPAALPSPRPSVSAGLRVQRKCKGCEDEEPAVVQRAPKPGASSAFAAENDAPPTTVSEPEALGLPPEAAGARLQAAEPTSPGPAPALAWLAGDEAAVLAAGQMRKSEFLDRLRAAVCATTDEGLAGTGRTSAGCPWIAHWFDHYAGQSAEHLERAVRRFAPEAAFAAGPAEAVPLVAARVRRSVDQWALSGEIAGLPEGVGPDLPGGVLAGGLFFKTRGAAAPVAGDPASVRARLGPGAPLPGGLRARMEGAYETSFAHVRLHTDGAAARLADAYGARAFTVGEHVAFGAGEYEPGTLAGQALMAHELAHVLQQGRGAQRAARGGSGSTSLEREADASAVGAVTAIATGQRRGLAAVAPAALPRLKSGLRLQRCGRHDPVPSPTPEIEATQKALGGHVAECMIRANEPGRSDSGIHYAHIYRYAFPGDWEESYRDGYANPDYWERSGFMHWRLKSGRSASAAVKAWLRGLTIAECYSTVIACEVDAVRAAIGDAKFDRLYGSEDGPALQPFEMGMRGATPLQSVLKFNPPGAGEGTLGHRPAQVGEWHYFYNHPMYLLKHPAGAFQGENAVLRADTTPAGEQLWEGLGEARKTERRMLEDMLHAYNAPQTEWDRERLEQYRQKYGGRLPHDHDPANKVYPQSLNSIDDILNAGAYTLTDPLSGVKTTRKGGFRMEAGKWLDAAAVREIRDWPF